jgi:Ni,Fe-hydrogenase I small subunit
MHNHETDKLCPNCPAKAWIDYAKKTLKDQQYTQEKEEPSALKICQELRRIIPMLNIPPCPYYPETETLNYYLTPEEKRRIDRKNELLKRQNLQHFL